MVVSELWQWCDEKQRSKMILRLSVIPHLAFRRSSIQFISSKCHSHSNLPKTHGSVLQFVWVHMWHVMDFLFLLLLYHLFSSSFAFYFYFNSFVLFCLYAWLGKEPQGLIVTGRREWPVISLWDLSVSIIESFKHCWLLAGEEILVLWERKV